MHRTETNPATLLKWGKTGINISKQHMFLKCCRCKLHWAGIVNRRTSQQKIKDGESVIVLGTGRFRNNEVSLSRVINSKQGKCSGGDESVYIYSLITK